MEFGELGFRIGFPQIQHEKHERQQAKIKIKVHITHFVNVNEPIHRNHSRKANGRDELLRNAFAEDHGNRSVIVDQIAGNVLKVFDHFAYEQQQIQKCRVRKNNRVEVFEIHQNRKKRQNRHERRH